MKNIVLSHFLLILTTWIGTSVHAQNRIGNYGFNGIVHAIVNTPDGSTYVGGEFTQIGLYSGNGVIMDTSIGTWDLKDTKVEGNILSSVAIPQAFGGGWYIGGEFKSIDGQVRNRLARINPDGSLHPFNPNMDYAVRALAVDANGNLYAGGSFTTIGGSINRNSLAKFDATGTLTNFNPNITGGNSTAVYELVFDANGSLFVGGDFTTIGGATTRNRLAKFDSAGVLESFNPNFSWMVYAIAFDAQGNLYVGGNFLSVNGQSYSRLAKFDSSGVLTSFSPNPDYAVLDLAVDTSGGLYVGGWFNSISGVSRNHLAKFNSSGTIMNFNPLNISSLNTVVNTLAIDATGNLYVGGEIGLIGTASRNRLAKFNHSGVLTSFDPNMNDMVLTVALNDSGSIFAGGEFFTVGGDSTRRRLAKLDNEGQLTSFNPNMNRAVYSLARDTSGNLYAGGDFYLVSGSSTRNGIAKFNNNDVLTSFSPVVNQQVNALALDAIGNIYVGGDFNKINGTTRNHIAKLDPTGTLMSFNPNTNAAVHALAVDVNGNLYVGGIFTTIGGTTTRNYIAKFDSSEVLTSFNPNINGNVLDFALDDKANLYVGGAFTTIGGSTIRNRLAKFDASGSLTSFNPNLNEAVLSLAIDTSGNLYAGGSFTLIDNIARNRLAKFDSAGILTSFSPNMSQCVAELAIDASQNLHAGGCFMGNYAYFCFTPPTITTVDSGAICGTGSVTLQATASGGAAIKWYTDSIGGSPLFSGATFTTPIISSTKTYYVEADNGGCSSNQRIPVMATIGTTTPNAPTGPTNQSFCDVATVADLSPTGIGIKWYDAPNAGNLLSKADTLTSSTQYYASQTLSGCESTSRLAVVVTINSVDTSVTNNSPLLTSNEQGAIYQWLDCANGYAPINGETNQSYTATANGQYAVAVTQNGCTDTSACFAVLNIGIEENSFGKSLRVFPNPTTGNFSIHLGNVYPNIQITITDISGRLIASKTVGNTDVLDLNIDEKAGMYLVKLKSGDKSAMVKLIKE